MATCNKKNEAVLEEQRKYLDYLREQLSDKKSDILEHKKNLMEIKRLIGKTKNMSTSGYQRDINRLTTEIALDMKIQKKYQQDIRATERKIKKLQSKCTGY